MNQERRGLLLGIAAYSMWGVFPLYFPLMEPAGAVEILAHRIVWSVLTMVVLVVVVRRTGQLRALPRDRRARAWLAVAALVIAVNWGVYIWATTHEHVVEASLGYFINPLVSVLLGVLFLGERLRRGQWWALSLAGVAVVVLAVDYGSPPWVSLALAFSFGTYGLAKKQANRGAVEGLTFETLLLAPISLGYLVWLHVQGDGTFLNQGAGHVALLVSLGLVTAVPLLCFGAAATRISLTTIGMLQYLTPTLQFVIGVALLGEGMTPVRWVGFVLVWLALAIFTAESLGHRHRAHRRQALAPLAT